MDSFQQETIRLKLDEMFNDVGHFSICDVDKIGKLVGVNVKSHPDYKYLSALHCMDYSKMSAEMKAELPNRVMNVLSAKFDTDLMAKALIAVVNSEIKDQPCIEDREVKENKLISLFKS